MLERIKTFFHLKKEVAESDYQDKTEALFKNLTGDVVRILVGSDFVEFGDEICETIQETRDNIFDEYGFVLSNVHILDSDKLQENEFVVKVRGAEVYHEFVIPNKDEILSEIKNAINFVFDNYIDEIFSYEIMEKYFDTLREKNHGLVYQLTGRLTVMQIRKLLVNLLKQGKSIKDLPYVFEKIADNVLMDDLYSDINLKKLTTKVIESL